MRVGSKRLVIRDDWTGTVERVNTDLLRLLLDAGYLPRPRPTGHVGRRGGHDVDGDRAATAMVAATFEAEALVILSNVPGLLRAFPTKAA